MVIRSIKAVLDRQAWAFHLAGCHRLAIRSIRTAAPLLNSGVEAAIDRIGPDWHELSKRAKDMGSAAVLLALLLCAGIWAGAVYQRFFHG